MAFSHRNSPFDSPADWPSRDEARVMGENRATSNDATHDEHVEGLMRRCQRGVGGRDALEDAHSIMADCYGTLGRLMLDRQGLRRRVAELEASALRAAGMLTSGIAERTLTEIASQYAALATHDAERLQSAEATVTGVAPVMAAQQAQHGRACSDELREQGLATPRTCQRCGLGPCQRRRGAAIKGAGG